MISELKTQTFEQPRVKESNLSRKKEIIRTMAQIRSVKDFFDTPEKDVDLKEQEKRNKAVEDLINGFYLDKDEAIEKFIKIYNQGYKGHLRKTEFDCFTKECLIRYLKHIDFEKMLDGKPHKASYYYLSPKDPIKIVSRFYYSLIWSINNLSEEQKADSDLIAQELTRFLGSIDWMPKSKIFRELIEQSFNYRKPDNFFQKRFSQMDSQQYEEVNKQEIVEQIKNAQDDEKTQLIRTFIETAGADFIINNIEELDISPKEEEVVFVMIAQLDPEALLKNLDNFKLKEHDRQKILQELFIADPLKSFFYADELGLSQAERFEFFTEIINTDPAIFLLNEKEMLKKVSIKEKDYKIYDQKMASVIKSNIYSGNDILKKFPEQIILKNINPKFNKTIKQIEKIKSATMDTLAKEIFKELEQKFKDKGDYISTIYVDKFIKEFLAQRNLENYLDEVFVALSLKDKEDRYSLPTWRIKSIDQAFAPLFLKQQIALLENDENLDCVDFISGFNFKSINQETKQLFRKKFELIKSKIVAQNDDFSNILYKKDIFGLIDKAYSDASEKREQYKKIIDVNPELLLESYIPSLYRVLSQEDRQYFIDVLLEKNPKLLAAYYYKIRLTNKKQEEEVFKKFISLKVPPFTAFQGDIGLLGAMCRNMNFEWLWFLPEKEAIQKILLFKKTREELDQKTWSHIMSFERHDEVGSFGYNCLQRMDFENFQAYEALIQNKDLRLYKHIFAGQNFSRKTQLLIYLSPDNLGDLEEKMKQVELFIAEQEKFAKKQKPKKGSQEKKFILYDSDVAALIIISQILDCSINKAYKIKRNIEKFSNLNFLYNKETVARALDFVMNYGDELKDFIEVSAVSSSNKIMEVVLNAEDPKAKYEFLKKWANALDSPKPIWSQYARLSKEMVLEHESEGEKYFRVAELLLPISPDSYMLEGLTEEEKAMIFDISHEYNGKMSFDLSEINIEIFSHLVEKRLQAGFDIPRSEIQRATERNRDFVEQFADQELIIPNGSLIHYSNQSSLSAILETGNLCGECLGIDSSSDSFPFHVDSVKVIADNDKDRSVPSVFQNFSYGGDFFLLYSYRNQPQSFHYQEEINLGTRGAVNNHHLLFVNIPVTELSAIVLSKSGDESDQDDFIEQAKNEIVKNNIYIPIFNHEGSLIFTIDDYYELKSELKNYYNLEDLIESEQYYEGLDIEQAGSHAYTLKEHSIKVAQAVTKKIIKTKMPEKIKNIAIAAARLHDIGKMQEEAQEISNVLAAKQVLEQVECLAIEDKRRILKLIRNDEILGEILQGMEKEENGAYALSYMAKQKFERFKEIFEDPFEFQAIIALYIADVQAIGGREYEDWEVEQKLKFLNLI